MPRVRCGQGSPASDPSGSALVVALAIAGVLLALVGTVSTRAVGSVRAAQGLEHRTIARAAAEHALEDVIRSLAGPEQRAAIVGRDPVGPPLSGGVDGRDPLVVDGAGVHIEVEVVDGATPDERVITVRASIDDVSQVTTARVRPFLTADHVLMTEHRTVDPTLLQLPRSACAGAEVHPDRSPRCVDAVLELGALDGPVHLNEPGVLGPTTTSGPLSTWSRPEADAPSTALRTGASSGAQRPDLMLPRTIGEVIGDASVTCRLRGPTSIRFDGMAVRIHSPRSARADDGASDGDRIGCMGVDPVAFRHVVELVLPEDAVIEIVRDDDVDCTAHPLGIAPEEDAGRWWSCWSGDAFVWGRYDGRRTVLAEDDIQIVWDLEPGDAVGPSPTFGRALLGLVAGDSIVFRRPVSPPVRRIAPLGRNLPFAGPGVPPFGEHPLDAPSEVLVTWDRPRVVAALAALRGSVTLQNPFLGQTHPGPLEIVGSVAGRFPGVLAWEVRTEAGALVGTTGYPVVLRYDERLLLDAPMLLPMTEGGGLRVLHRDVG